MAEPMLDFSQVRRLWISSYPRSGNTLVRTILFQCFGLSSASLYPDDLGGNITLQNYVGHLERNESGKVDFAEGALKVVKVHETGDYRGPAIYVLRNGLDVTVSFYKFYKGRVSFDQIIMGQHRFGTWAHHVRDWNPYLRPKTLVLRYEDIVSDFPSTLARLSDALGMPILKKQLPKRDRLASVGGKWVNQANETAARMTDDEMKLFDAINGEAMRAFGYELPTLPA